MVSSEAIAELLEDELAMLRADPAEGPDAPDFWASVLAMFEEAAIGLRADCEWAPREAHLLEEPSAGALMMGFFAGRALDSFQADLPVSADLTKLYFRYAEVLRTLDPESTTLYEPHGAFQPPANPLFPDARATALGAPEGLDNELLEAVGERFADAHSFAATLLRSFVERAEVPAGAPARYKDGMAAAADMCDAIAASVRPYEIAENPDHPLFPLLFSESDLLLMRAYTAEMGRALKAWAGTQPPGRTRTLAESAGSALMEGETAMKEIVAEDAGALARVAAKLESMIDGLTDSPFSGDESWCMMTAAIHVTDHYRRAVLTVEELRPDEYVPGAHLVPPPPDLLLLTLEALIAGADPDVKAGVAAGFGRGALFAADILAGTALTAASDDDHRALMIAACTAERRVRKLMMGPEIQAEPYDDALTVIIR